MAPFYLGRFSQPVRPAAVIPITRPAQTETVRNGDIVEVLDRIFEWDDDCVKASALERRVNSGPNHLIPPDEAAIDSWRARGDDVCDAALESMFTSPFASSGADLLSALESKAAEDGDSGGPASHFLREASERPPRSIAATAQEMQRAQAFFWSNAVPIMTSLLHFSLAGGFASPRITRVLSLSSYLIPPAVQPGKPTDESITKASNDRTFVRLNETAQFVLEVMGAPPPAFAHPEASTTEKEKETAYEHCMLPGAHGWQSALRVRMLHATVRRRVLARAAQNGTYSVPADGVPVNQEDLAGTLAAFAAAPLRCMADMGWRATAQERDDFVALWRVVGFYLGVAPDILEKHFMRYAQAEKFLASVVVHLLDFSDLPPGAPPGPTIPILRAISERPPFRTALAHHMALTRFLLGPKLSDHLGVERTSLSQAARLRISLFVSRYPRLFGELYPRKAWDRRRVAVTREGVRRLTRFNLGLRRTTFRPRDADAPELDEGVRTAEVVLPDPVGARRMMAEYRLMLLEMCVVSAGGALVACTAMWILARRLWDWL